MLTLSIREQMALAVNVDLAVSRGLASGGMLGRTPSTEPEAVMAVFSSLSQAHRGWTATLAPLGLKITMRGVFIHATPQVLFNRTTTGRRERCELGDLLVAVDDRRKGRDDRHAVIIQAKPVKGPVLSLPGVGDQRQLDLNRHWPPFDFFSSAYPASTMDFRHPRAPGNVSQSSRYGAVNIAAGTWEQLIPARTMRIGGGESLGVTLASMVVGRGGRQAEIPAIAGTCCADDWSETIELLLRKTAALTTSRRLGATSRGFAAFQITTDTAGNDVSYFEPGAGAGGRGALPGDRLSGDDEDAPAMSTFRIILSSVDDPVER